MQQKKQYQIIKNSLNSDIRLLKDGVTKMEEEINHVNKLSG